MHPLLTTFPRSVPVFPLAEVVLFPGALLPLHIFEKRYQAMVKDVLKGDKLIAMALLQECTKREYEERPPFHETVCVGQVIHHEALPKGRSNIALLGLSAGLAQPVDGPEPYRTARVDLLADRFDADDAYEEKLRRAFAEAVPGGGDVDGLREQLLGFLAVEDVPAALLNTCALTAPLQAAEKLELLEVRSVARRLDRLLELLARPWRWN
ncbi:MAG: LON peptidase substrate-binding domain-containing protein [Planctomycetes bacterium]|nr:LON peptidase substrate-binding domain-containing protein [Planctomycetota bacterium]